MGNLRLTRGPPGPYTQSVSEKRDSETTEEREMPEYEYVEITCRQCEGEGEGEVLRGGRITPNYVMETCGRCHGEGVEEIVKEDA